MMGELTTRLEEAKSNGAVRGGQTADWASRIEDFPPANPHTWPQALSEMAAGAPGLVIVVSASCKTCADFLDGDLSVLDDLNPSIVMSSPSVERAESFLSEHPAARARDWPVVIDQMGNWSRNELGVDISPSAIRFADGIGIEAYGMSSPTALADAVREHQEMKTSG